MIKAAWKCIRASFVLNEIMFIQVKDKVELDDSLLMNIITASHVTLFLAVHVQTSQLLLDHTSSSYNT